MCFDFFIFSTNYVAQKFFHFKKTDRIVIKICIGLHAKYLNET
jgi:predicted Na+-dependent transporter